MLLCSKDRRDVFIITTVHDYEFDKVKKRNEVKRMPHCVLDYIQYIGEVGKVIAKWGLVLLGQTLRSTISSSLCILILFVSTTTNYIQTRENLERLQIGLSEKFK